MESMLRVRIGLNDAHYAGNLVDGARILQLFGDNATELLIRHDGDEGLFLTYEKVEFLAPVYGGDYIESRGKITKVGNTSRQMEFSAYKVITADPLPGQPSGAMVLGEPILVARAEGVCVVPKERQRKEKEGS